MSKRDRVEMTASNPTTGLRSFASAFRSATVSMTGAAAHVDTPAAILQYRLGYRPSGASWP